MKYYILHHHDENSGFVDGDVEFFPALSDYYQVGQDVLLKNTKVDLVLDKRVKKLVSDFFLTSCGAFFVSEELKDLLSQHEVELDFYPASSTYHNGKATERSYMLLHANSKLDCFDYVKSEYSGKSLILDKVAKGELLADYKVRGIKRLCIDDAKSKARSFLFVDKIIWIDPLVSESVVSEARRLGLNLNFQEAC